MSHFYVHFHRDLNTLNREAINTRHFTADLLAGGSTMWHPEKYRRVCARPLTVPMLA